MVLPALAATYFAAADQPFSKTPYVQMPARDVATLLWEAPGDYPAVVRHGPGDRLTQTQSRITVTKMTSRANTASAKESVTRTFWLYEARLEGLVPGQLYSYSVELNGTPGEPRQFRMIAPGAPETRFIVYGDSRSDPAVHRALTRRFLDHQPDFILHSGDLVARGQDYDLWSREFFGPAADVISRVPLFPVIGNHEQDGTNYLAYFDLPGTELWYSFDAGPVHVLALDFRRPHKSDEQYLYAQGDLLKSRAPWKLVVVHTPMYNVGGHVSRWGREYLPLFRKAKVDLVLSGHSHLYERFRPLAPQSKRPSWAITHITTGGGGANLHPGFDHPALVRSDTTNHYMVFHASRESLRAEAIRPDGVLLDRFELQKEKGRYRRAFLDEYYPEQSLDLFYEFAPVLAPRLADLPAPDLAAPVLLSIPPRTNAAPAELVLSLAGSTLKHYELVNGPVRLNTPGPGKTNLVWVEVRAVPGQAVSTNRSGELVPPLRFQAEIKTARGQGLALGANGRLSQSARDARRDR